MFVVLEVTLDKEFQVDPSYKATLIAQRVRFELELRY